LPPDHGTAFDRINAFQEGFEQGPARCAEYIDEDGAPFNAPPVLDLEFDEPDDTGDVSLNQSIRFTEELLDAYWPLAYGEYEPIDEQVAYEIDDPDEVDADDLEDAACGDEEPDPEALDDAIFYCEEENFVGWDEDLLEEAYDDTGDFGVATVIGEQYAHAVANQQGVTGEDLAVNLYADCLNGSWTGAIYNNALDVDVVLSPGDLDQAVQSLLAFRDDVAVETPERGSAFQRVQAFRTGFFEGPNACNRVLAGEGS
jgi:predicted metalloprotease